VAAPVKESWIGPFSGWQASARLAGGRPGGAATALLAEGLGADDSVEETAAARGSRTTDVTARGPLAVGAGRASALPFPLQEASATKQNLAHARHAIPLCTSLRLAPPGPFWHGPAMRWLKVRKARALGLCFTAGLGVACGSSPPQVPTRPPVATAKPAVPPAPPPAQNPAYLPSQIVAQLDDENAAVYYAQRGADGLVFYASRQRWLTRGVAADGTPKGKEPLDLGAAPEGAKAVLKAVGDGYLAVWIEPVAKNHAIKALSLDEAGKPRGEPTLVTQVTEELLTVDLLPAGKGSLVLWEIQRDDHSDLLVLPLDGSKPTGAPVLAARDVMGWEPASTDKGAAIATVVAAGQQAATPSNGGKGKKTPPVDPEAESLAPRGSKLGLVQLIELDDKGRPGAPIAVSNEPTAQVDVELAVAGGKYLLAWTDERHIDPCVFTAAVEPGGKLVQAPRRATVPFGEQALVALVDGPFLPGGPGSKRALLAWEDQLRTPPEGRLIHVATIGPDGALGKERASVLFSASGRPEIVPDGEGFAAMTLAPAPEIVAEPEPLPEPGDRVDAPAAIKAARPRKREIPVLPFYVRFGADLAVLDSEPILAAPFPSQDFTTDGSPYLTRNLSCIGGSCFALASGLILDKAQGAPLATVSLPIRKSRWKPAAQRDPDEVPPRPESVAALFDGEYLSEVAGADLPGGGSLAAWVTYYLDGASNRPKKAGKKDEEGPFATLAVRPVGADGNAGKTVTISRKALSTGGVAMAAIEIEKGGEKKPETTIAWVARDKGEPQVYVTKVDAAGNKLAQKGLTVINRKKAKGGVTSEVSDVAIAADGNDGWVVAWVDTRDGNSEIYVARVDRSLTKVVPDRRISEAAGDSVEVQLAVRGKEVLVVWADARQNPSEGNCDIYLAQLEASSLKKIGMETRLFASALHSRTPQITPAGSGFLVSWIEDAFGEKADSNVAAAERGLRVAQLDARGTMIGVPALVRGEKQSSVTSSAIACRARGCRGVLTSAVGESLIMGAFELVPGASAGPLKTIAALTGPVTEDVSPSFTGANGVSLFFADNAVGGSGRVRWMQIAWP